MRFLKKGAVALSALALMGLTACGGGGDQVPEAPASNTLQLESGTTSFPAGTYVLSVDDGQSSGRIQLSNQVLEWVYPENSAFDVGFYFSQSDSRKFTVALLDQSDDDTVYNCVSSAWTSAELAELAALFEEPDMASVPKCPAGVTIEAAKHRIRVNKLHLVATNNPGKAVTFTADFQWALQGEIIDISVYGSGSSEGGTGSGSGSGSGAVSGSGLTLNTQFDEAMPLVKFVDPGPVGVAIPGP